jgi:hypothetical protein
VSSVDWLVDFYLERACRILVVIRPKMTESEFVEKQLENLKVLRRQSTIHNMYYTDSFTVSR